MIIDRINALLAHFSYPHPMLRANWGMFSGPYPKDARPDLHEVLNQLDSAIGADTEWLRKGRCACVVHFGNTCDNRRAVGARVKMLEEIMLARR